MADLTSPTPGPLARPSIDLRDALRAQPGRRIRLRDLDTSNAHGWTKEAAGPALDEQLDRLTDLQDRLWAEGKRAVLVVLQGIDAAGKDGTIKKVMTAFNPQGCPVTSFKVPSSEELAHDYLWRVHKAVPRRGEIGIFNRSHYEEVVALRVHPEWLDRQKLPKSDRGPGFWAGRYDDINGLERHLDRNGTKVVKFFLHVSKAEQKRRFMARLDNPDKLWKFSAADVAERAHWDEYMRAYDDAITATSTDWAPWYVIPADHKHVMQAMAAAIVADTIGSLDLQWPTVSDQDRDANAKARSALEAESDD